MPSPYDDPAMYLPQQPRQAMPMYVPPNFGPPMSWAPPPAPDQGSNASFADLGSDIGGSLQSGGKLRNILRPPKKSPTTTDSPMPAMGSPFGGEGGFGSALA